MEVLVISENENNVRLAEAAPSQSQGRNEDGKKSHAGRVVEEKELMVSLKLQMLPSNSLSISLWRTGYTGHINESRVRPTTFGTNLLEGTLLRSKMRSSV